MTLLRKAAAIAKFGGSLSKYLFSLHDSTIRGIPIGCRAYAVQSAASTTVNNRQDGNIVKSPYKDVHIPEINMTHHLMKGFSQYSNRNALVDGVTGQAWTYTQLTDAITRVGSSLVKMGLKPGDVLTLMAPNSPEFVILYLAVIAVGGILSPVNPLYTKYELKTTLQHSDSKFFAFSPILSTVALEAAQEFKDLKLLSLGDVPGTYPWSKLTSEGTEHFPSSSDVNAKEDVCCLPYSSGTTGLPKGVMLTHYNLVAQCEQTANDYVVNYKKGEEVLVAVLPYFHIYAQAANVLCGLLRGATQITMPKFDPLLFLQLIQNHKVTAVHIVPPIANFLANHPLVDQFKLTHLHSLFTGAAPISTDLMAKVVERLKLQDFRSCYGMTESSPGTHSVPPNVKRYGSCGLAFPNVSFKIINPETGEALGPNQSGELLVRGPNVMKGYYKNAEATASMIRDGWLHTGDLGYYEDDGYFSVTDRLKELIKVKGSQVAPAELEALLMTHAKILDAAVIGTPDERSGEVPRAYIVLKPGQAMTEDEVKNFVVGKVAHYKELQGGVEFCYEIPKSSAGKILRRLLKGST